MVGNVVNGDEGVMNEARTPFPTSSTRVVREMGKEYGPDVSRPVSDGDVLGFADTSLNVGFHCRWGRGRDEIRPVHLSPIPTSL